MSSDKQFYSIKLDHYLPLYDVKFPRDPKCILEIGVCKGGSLRALKRRYPNALIVGIDIDPRCKNAEEDGIKVFIGSQTDRGFLEDTLSHIPVPDVVIDDGGHRPYQQLKSFKTLFRAMRPGGVYCVEDLIVGYELKWRLWQRAFGGFMPKMFSLVNKMNTDAHCTITAIEFHPWMVFITKGVNHFKLVAAGTEDCRVIKRAA